MTNMYQSLAYADQFGAEKTHADALNLNIEIANTEIEIAGAASRLRRNRALLVWREEEIAVLVTVDATKVDEKVSQAAIDRKVKAAVAVDPQVRELNEFILGVQEELDRHVAVLSGHKVAHKTAIARIESLGGWFHFLGAVKDANTQHEVAVAATPF
jgi:hypothetical protein